MNIPLSGDFLLKTQGPHSLQISIQTETLPGPDHIRHTQLCTVPHSNTALAPELMLVTQNTDMGPCARHKQW